MILLNYYPSTIPYLKRSNLILNKIYNEDCLTMLKKIKPNLIDLIVTDPPYFLSNGGKSIKNGKVVSVNKGEWDKAPNDLEKVIFTENWMTECQRILKSNGSIFITGTTHNIFDIYSISKKLNLRLVNMIVWNKTAPPPLIYKNKFGFSAEYILWFSKGQIHTFNYDDVFKIENKEMTDVWRMPAVKATEKKFGYHPTQKPIELMERIILSSSNKGDIVLDPFMGSGTTCVAAKELGRKFIGFEKEYKYFEIARKRLNL